MLERQSSHRPGKPWHGTQTSRCVRRGTHWYVRTREGIAIGPHSSEFDAKLTAGLLVSRLEQSSDAGEQRSVIMQFSLEYGAYTPGSREEVVDARGAASGDVEEIVIQEPQQGRPKRRRFATPRWLRFSRD